MLERNCLQNPNSQMHHTTTFLFLLEKTKCIQKKKNKTKRFHLFISNEKASRHHHVFDIVPSNYTQGTLKNPTAQCSCELGHYKKNIISALHLYLLV